MFPLHRWADRCVLHGVFAFSARRLWRERWLHSLDLESYLMSSHWLRKLLNRVVRSTLAERNMSRRKSRTRTRKHSVELLDVRLLLAATTFNGGILTVDLNSDNEAAILTNDGTNISLTSNVAITGVGGSSFSTANVTKIMITNVINKPGQSIVFAGTAAYSLSDGLASSGVETNTFNVGVTATGAASISVTAPQSIIVNANLTGGTGGTTLLGQGLAVLNTDGVTVQSGAVVSATGNVSVTGQGGSGSGGNNHGVYVYLSGKIAAGGTGTVTVSGTGGSGSGDNNYGVYVYNPNNVIDINSTITSGAGTLTVSGTGGSGSGSLNHGVFVRGIRSAISSGGGNVNVTGQGGGGVGSGNTNYGVYLLLRGNIKAGGSGTTTVSGTGGSSSGGGNTGVYMNQTSSDIRSSGGNVSVTGQGGSGGGDNNWGVYLTGQAVIVAGGSGTVTVSGTGGSGSGDDNNGVVVNGINSVTNSLPLDDPAWQGLSGITSGGGNVRVTGEGGGGSGDRNTGVVVSGGGGVGVDIFFVRGKISAGGSGTVTVTGTGGSGTGSGHYGVYVKDNTNVKITSGGGRISVIGTGTANSEGVRLENSGTITSGSNAAITVTADSVNILVGSTTHSRSGTTQDARIQAIIDALVADSTINSGSGTTTIQTRTAGTQIDLGGADVLSGTLTLGLPDAELDLITAGTIQVGNASSGAITVSAAITPSGTSNLSLTTGANVIDGNAPAGSDLTVATISIVASTGISTSGNPLEVDASTFANVQTATGGIYIDIQDSGDVGHTVTSASATTSGNVVFTASTGGGTNTYVFNSVTAANGNIDLSKSVGGNINVGNLNAAGTTGKTISVNVGSGNADSISHLGGTTIQTNGGQISLVANQMTLGGSSITSGAEDVVLHPFTAAEPIQVGGAVAGAALSLLEAGLNTITTGGNNAIVVGVSGSTSGTILVVGSTNLATKNLKLVTDNATSSAIADGTVGVGGNLITVGTLTLTAPSGGIDANFDATTLNTTSRGTQFLQEANSVTIGTSGLTAGSSTITLGGGTFIPGGSDRINDSTDVNVSGATFDIGDFSDTVNTLTLTSGAISGLSGVLTSTNTIQTMSGSASAILAGANGLTQSTGGSTTLSGTNAYTGVTTVTDGTLLVNGSIASEITVTGGILGGSGTVAGSVSISTGTIAPGNSPGILNTGNVNYTGGNLNLEINGTTPGNTGSDHDQMNVTGAVALGAGVTTLNLSGTYTTVMPAVIPTDSFVIIKNDGTDDSTGYFVGLPEGSPIVFNTQTLYITYKGGDGNDVVLSTNIFSGTDNDDAFVLTYSSTATTGSVLVSLSTNGGAAVDLGTFPMNAPVILKGLAGTDSVRVIGTAGTDKYVVSSSGRLTINGAVLMLDSIETTTLAGMAGDDLYQFDADTDLGVYTLDEPDGGIDTVDLSLTTTSGVTVNLGSATQQVVNSNLSLNLSSSIVFENATGGSGNDTLTGNSLGNTLTGNGGNDALTDNGGDDTLIGGLGDDTYVFGIATTAEADTVAEATSAGTDRLSFSTLTTDVILSLQTTDVQTVHANRTLKLNSGSVFEEIVGGSGNDTLMGNLLANTLTGGSGDDSLLGGSGDDTYVLGPATTAEADTVTEAANEGQDTLSFSTLTTDVMLSLETTDVQTVHANRMLKLNATDVLENIAGGSGNDTLTGNSLANILVGNAGDDTLTGGGGRDILIGGPGLDTLDGGEDEDILIAGFTTSDAVFSHLNVLLAEWVSVNSYDTRIINLRAGVGDPVVSLKVTVNVLDDAGEVDSLVGGNGTDWYFGVLDEVVTGLATDEVLDIL